MWTFSKIGGVKLYSKDFLAPQHPIRSPNVGRCILHAPRVCASLAQVGPPCAALFPHECPLAPVLLMDRLCPHGSQSLDLRVDARRGCVCRPQAPAGRPMAASNSCSRWLWQVDLIATYATPDLLLQHPDETLATYVQNR
jgi:hypothetical protein